jgi:hypothetical protein
MQNADLIQPSERRSDRRCAVVDVVDIPNCMHTGEGERLGGYQTGVEAFVLNRAFTFWLLEATFQVGKDHVGCAQPLPHTGKWNGWVGHAKQVDIAG